MIPVNKNCPKINIRTVVRSKLFLIYYLIRFFIHNMEKVDAVEIYIVLICAQNRSFIQIVVGRNSKKRYKLFGFFIPPVYILRQGCINKVFLKPHSVNPCSIQLVFLFKHIGTSCPAFLSPFFILNFFAAIYYLKHAFIPAVKNGINFINRYRFAEN